MTERARWMLLNLSLVLALGGGLVGAYWLQESNDRARQRDLCEMLAVFIDPGAPPPTTDRGRVQADALRAYRAKRC